MVKRGAPTGAKPAMRQTTKGVRIACIGEQKAGVEELTTYDVPLDHDVFTIGELCPVSELVRLPFLVSRVRPSLRYAATRDSYGYDLSEAYYPNQVVKDLMICCEAKWLEESDGEDALLETPKRWSEGVGSVIVVRKDRRPLYAHHVKILLDLVTAVRMFDANPPNYQSCL